MEKIIIPDNIERDICKILNIDTDQYRRLVFSSAMQYLEERFKEWPKIATEIATTSMFWNWWSFQFSIIDNSLLLKGYNDIKIWEESHSEIELEMPYCIVSNIYKSNNTKKIIYEH
jgi:hypothetical protein